jgi:hypothetical protein
MASSINASTSGAGGVITTADNSGVLNIQTAGTTAVTVDASQNVGIGTSSPTSIGNFKSLTLNGTTGVLLDAQVGGTIVSRLDSRSGEVALNSYGTLAFGTGSGGSSTERMRIDSGGNVITKQYSTWQQSDGSTAAGYIGRGNNVISGGSNTDFGIVGASGNLVFASGGNTERMRIDSSGNLLVGTTNNPTTSKLNVAGTVMAANNNVNASAGNEYFYINGGDRYIVTHGTSLSGGAVHFYFQNPNGIVGSIETNGSATSYITSSDYRLKENIAPMTGALARVSALKPVTYSWKVDGSSGQGFIAHELQSVVPDCVTGEKDAVDEEGKPKYQGIDTSFLVATLTAAIQEQQALITQLQADVAALKGAK